MKPPFPHPWRFALLKHANVWLIGVTLALLLTVACGDGAPTLSESAKDLAIDEIMEYPQVLGAAVGQDGKTLTLALVVAFGSAESSAMDAGDDFVRVVKSYGPESAPGANIGTGEFNYSVTVVYPDKTVIVRGAKASSGSRVIWPQVKHPRNLPQI